MLWDCAGHVKDGWNVHLLPSIWCYSLKHYFENFICCTIQVLQHKASFILDWNPQGNWQVVSPWHFQELQKLNIAWKDLIGHTTKWITLSHANAITRTKIRLDNRVKHLIIFKEFENFENRDTLTKVNYSQI